MLYPLTFKTELGSRIQFFQPSSTCALRVKAGRNGAIDSQNRTITHTVMSQLFIYISFCCKNEMKLRLTISLQYCAAYAACAWTSRLHFLYFRKNIICTKTRKKVRSPFSDFFRKKSRSRSVSCRNGQRWFRLLVWQNLVVVVVVQSFYLMLL